jgi:hypothetical protein
MNQFHTCVMNQHHTCVMSQERDNITTVNFFARKLRVIVCSPMYIYMVVRILVHVHVYVNIFNCLSVKYKSTCMCVYTRSWYQTTWNSGDASSTKLQSCVPCKSKCSDILCICVHRCTHLHPHSLHTCVHRDKYACVLNRSRLNSLACQYIQFQSSTQIISGFFNAF